MDHLPQLIANLHVIEEWLNAHINDRVANRLNQVSHMIMSRRLLLRRILKLQIREFNRDG